MTFSISRASRFGWPLLSLPLFVLAAACGGSSSSPTPTATRAIANATASASAAQGTAAYDAMAAALDKASYPADLVDGLSIGKKDAKVVIQAYEDFTCSHCLDFTSTMEPGIVEQMVKPGTVRLEFHYLPLRQFSVGSMVAAQCAADQNRFWEYQKRLFMVQAQADAKPQDQYSQAMNDGFGEAALKQYAVDLGLETAKFNDCIANPQTAIDHIQADLAQASKLGIQGTPSFVVNGKFLSNGYPSTLAAWKQLVDSAAK